MTTTAYAPTELELLRHKLAQEQTVSLNALPMLEEALKELAAARDRIMELEAENQRLRNPYSVPVDDEEWSK
jgi:hypothetical protein